MRTLPKLAGLLLTGLLLAMWMGTAARAQSGDAASLRTAAEMDANLSALLELLEEGADPNAPDTRGRTALHYAAGGGAPRNLEALLAAGGKPDVQDGDGNTPLHIAADASSPTLVEREFVAVIRVLLDGGASPNVPNRRGDTPLHVAARSFSRHEPAGVELLLRAGADPNKTNERGNTPLHAAVEPYSRHSDTAVGALLDAGANPKAVNRDGLTPLLLFVRNGPDDGRPAALLVQAGADPDRKAPDGDAPLHIAIREGGNRGKEEVVDALLAGGADPCIEDAKGFIPYNVAEEGGHIHRALDRADGYDRACDIRAGGAAATADAKAAEGALGLTRDQRRRVQQGLAAAGFDPGPADGAFGPRTRAAIGGWQDARGNDATGYLDEGQAQALLAAAPDPVQSPAADDRGDTDEDTTSYETALAALERRSREAAARAKLEVEQKEAPSAGKGAAQAVVTEPKCTDFSQEEFLYFREKNCDRSNEMEECVALPDALKWTNGRPPACWAEVGDQPGCYAYIPVGRVAWWIWDYKGEVDFSPEWTGQCSGGVATGRGTYIWRTSGIKHSKHILMEETGEMVDGKQQGRWTFRRSRGGGLSGVRKRI